MIFGNGGPDREHRPALDGDERVSLAQIAARGHVALRSLDLIASLVDSWADTDADELPTPTTMVEQLLDLLEGVER